MNWFVIIICLFCIVSTTKAFDEKPGEVEIIPYINKTENNEFEVILHFVIEKDWYIYWKNPGDSGIPTKFEWNLPAGIELVSDDWEIPLFFLMMNLPVLDTKVKRDSNLFLIRNLN